MPAVTLDLALLASSPSSMPSSSVSNVLAGEGPRRKLKRRRANLAAAGGDPKFATAVSSPTPPPPAAVEGATVEAVTPGKGLVAGGGMDDRRR